MLVYKCLSSYFTVDCGLSKWTKWTTCDKMCGGGTVKRNRTIIKKQNEAGKPCNETEQARPCNPQPCKQLITPQPITPQDCELSDYGDWTDCDKACGGGKKKRYRIIINQPTGDGKPCNGTEQVLSCNTQHCPFLRKYVFLLKLVNNTQ
jgi:hypothetical protein